MCACRALSRTRCSSVEWGDAFALATLHCLKEIDQEVLDRLHRGKSYVNVLIILSYSRDFCSVWSSRWLLVLLCASDFRRCWNGSFADSTQPWAIYILVWSRIISVESLDDSVVSHSECQSNFDSQRPESRVEWLWAHPHPMPCCPNSQQNAHFDRKIQIPNNFSWKGGIGKQGRGSFLGQQSVFKASHPSEIIHESSLYRNRPQPLRAND